MQKSRKFAFNVALLTASTLLLRGVGVAFNVFISNRLGAGGMGLFTLVMSVYGFAVTFATSGVGLAATRLVAEGLGTDNDSAVRESAKRALWYGASFGLVGAIILWLFAYPIGAYILDDTRTISSLRALALSLPFTAISSALGGYFNAVRRVVKSVSSQIITQVIRIGATSALFSMAFSGGVEGGAFAVAAGASVSETLSCVYEFAMYELDLRRHIRREGQPVSGLTRKLLSVALPVAFSAYFRSGLLTVEHILIPRGLKKFAGGSGETALATYGVLHGMVFPIVLFPMAFLSAFSGMLVPELAEERERGNVKHIDYMISRVTGLSLLFAVAVSGFMAAFAQELGIAIYDNVEAASFIRVLAPLIPVMYIDHITDGMLKGLGEQLYSMRVNIVDSALSCAAVWLILPHSGIKGYIVIIFICELLNTALSIGRLSAVVNIKLSIWKRLVLPILCIMGAVSVIRIFATAGRIVISSPLMLVFIAVFSSVLYMVLLRVTGSVSGEEIRWFMDIIGIGGINKHRTQKKRQRKTQPL